jgi:hypothetical protein
MLKSVEQTPPYKRFQLTFQLQVKVEFAVFPDDVCQVDWLLLRRLLILCQSLVGQ